MSGFENLIKGGADCSGGNPMSGLMKRFEKDRSIHQDRFEPDFAEQGTSRSAFRGGQANRPGQPIEQDFTNEFLREGKQENTFDTYNFNQLNHELDTIHGGLKPGPSNDWAEDFIAHGDNFSHGVDPQFAEFERVYGQHQHREQGGWDAEFARYEAQTGSAQHLTTEEAFDRAFEEAKHSGGWEEEFAKQESWTQEFQNQEAAKETGLTEELKTQLNADWTAEFGYDEEEILNKDWSKEFDPGNDWAAEFEAQEKLGEMAGAYSREEGLGSWVDQYKRNIAHLAQEPEDVAWEAMEKEWTKHQPTDLGYRANNPNYDHYSFELNNRYLHNPALLQSRTGSSGDLIDDILVLEAKVQLNPEDAASWHQLGARQQENEQDTMAIAALRSAVKIDPKLVNAWMDLAVSYTNENCRADAYDCLESWIRNHDQYSQVLNNLPSQTGERQRDVLNMFLEAARSNVGKELDPNVQVGLGVMLNITEEYDKAIDCFRAALASRPNDYLLWNKLGATTANSQKPAEAIDAYFKALELNPAYIRARYNLAVSCINLGQYHEAAEHLLQALALQGGDDGSPNKAMMSEEIWDTLRLSVEWLNRPDLVDRCMERNLEGFRGEFAF